MAQAGEEASRTACAGQRGHRVQVPLHGERVRREPCEERVGAALLGEREVEDADLALVERRHGAAVGVGQQLAAEADAEHRHAPRHRVPQQRLLVCEPGIEVLLVGLLRAAHGEHGVVVFEARHRLALPRVERMPGDAGLLHHPAEGAGLVDLGMPDDEDVPRAFPLHSETLSHFVAHGSRPAAGASARAPHSRRGAAMRYQSRSVAMAAPSASVRSLA